MIKISHINKCYLNRIVVCFILLASNLVLSSAHAQVEDKKLALDFTLKSNDNKNIKLSELRGQVIMVNFWANWCGTCVKQLPLLDKFQRKYKNKDFTVLSVNIDKNSKKAMSIAKKYNLTYPVLFDTYNHVSRIYSVSSIPVSILIDRDGYIRNSLNATKISQQTKTKQLIEELINE